MQFTLTCESVKGKAPVPSTLSSLPSRWGKLYPPRPLVRHLLERNSIWTSSGGVQFPPSPLPPVSPAAFSSIAAFSQLSYFGFILPSSLVLCHTLPQVEIPPKVLLDRILILVSLCLAWNLEFKVTAQEYACTCKYLHQSCGISSPVPLDLRGSEHCYQGV